MATACADTVTVCPGILYPAITLTVRDSLTGAAAASGVTAIATRHGDTSTHDLIPTTVVVPNDFSAGAAPIWLGSQPGTYDVVVTKEAYATWSKMGVVVDASGCETRTVSLDALLRKL
jgi:hypothetical protein